jgi:hypothetical protein
MRYREFEDHIKQSLEDNEVTIDIAALQGNIQAKLDKKRRFPFLWLMVAVLGIGTMGSLYYLNPVKAENSVIEDRSKTSSYTNSIPSNLNNDQATLSSKENRTPRQNNTPSPSAEKSLTITSNIDYINRQAVKNTNQNNAEQNNNIITNDKNESVINTKVSIDKAIKILNENTIQPLQNVESNSGSITSKSNTENDLLLKESQVTNTSTSIIKDAFNIVLLPTARLSQINSLSPFVIKGKEILCPTFSNKDKLLLSFIPEVGYFMPIKKLEPKQADLPNGVFSLRYDNEQSLEGISAGAHIKIAKENLPFYVKGGVVMSRITEKMKLSYTTIKRDTTIGIISLTKSPNGDTITTIYGPIVKETETSGINTKHYYLHLFDVPVSIGIEQSLGRLKLNAEIGAAFNVGLSTSGNILTTDKNYEDVKQGGRFRSSLGLNYFGSLGLEMPMTEKLSLQANLRGRYLPTDFTRADGTISQRYNTIGVNVGVVYSLNH